MSEVTIQPQLAPGDTNGDTELVCPECKEQGIDTVFETPQGLAAHRRRLHGVEGSSPRTEQRRERESKQPVEELVCPECKRTFASPQGLAHHRSAVHHISTPRAIAEQERRANVKTGVSFPCPECTANGLDVSFTTSKGLGAHRRSKHGVAGQSPTAQRERKQREAKARVARVSERKEPVRKATAAWTGATPARWHLNPREFAAYRLGVLDMMFHAIDEGSIEAPAAMFLAMFKAEQQERQAQLAESVS